MKIENPNPIQWQFSERAQGLQSSFIREILKITQRPEIISFAGGLLLNNWIGGWLDPAFGIAHGAEHAPSLLHITGVGIATLLLVAAGVAVAFVVFGPRKDIPLTAPQSRSPFTLAGRNDLYGDALNEAVLAATPDDGANAAACTFAAAVVESTPSRSTATSRTRSPSSARM